MTQQQPNTFAAGLRRALDIVRDNRDNAQRMKEMDAGKWVTGGLYQLDKLVDILSDQLLDAGGFLGDAPEPEEHAFILDRNGAVMAVYEVDELDPDLYAERFADQLGFEIDDSDGLIPDGCEDFSVRIAETPDAARCWTSRNYMMKGE